MESEVTHALGVPPGFAWERRSGRLYLVHQSCGAAASGPDGEAESMTDWAYSHLGVCPRGMDPG